MKYVYANVLTSSQRDASARADQMTTRVPRRPRRSRTRLALCSTARFERPKGCPRRRAAVRALPSAELRYAHRVGRGKAVC